MRKEKHKETFLGAGDDYILKIEHLFLKVAGEVGSRKGIQKGTV